MTLSVNPIFPIKERNPERRPFQERVVEGAEKKIRGFVLEKISQARGAPLLPSATAPQVVINLLPGFENKRGVPQLKRSKKRKIRRTPIPRTVPIGLVPVDLQGCVNALMQFVLSIPGFAEKFYFAPRSFYVFQEFIEQYHLDQQEKKNISIADGSSLFRFLSIRLEEFTLGEIFYFLISSLQLECRVYSSLDEALKGGRPDSFFLKGKSNQKQIISQPDCICYELDAFIELRSDGPDINHVTFLKVEGSWYQCDNECITQLRSYHLNGPLQRSTFFHYKRVVF